MAFGNSVSDMSIFGHWIFHRGELWKIYCLVLGFIRSLRKFKFVLQFLTLMLSPVGSFLAVKVVSLLVSTTHLKAGLFIRLRILR